MGEFYYRIEEPVHDIPPETWQDVDAAAAARDLAAQVPPGPDGKPVGDIGLIAMANLARPNVLSEAARKELQEIDPELLGLLDEVDRWMR